MRLSTTALRDWVWMVYATSLLSAKQAIEELQEATGITGATNTAWCVRIFVDLQDSKAHYQLCP